MPKTKTQRLVVIDGNPVVYRALYSKGTTNLTTSTGLTSGAFYGALNTFRQLKNTFGNSYYVWAFDTGKSWRNNFFDGYKTHCEETKPNGFLSQLSDVQRFLKMVGVPVFTQKNLEADDLIGVLACEWVKKEDHTSVIVSSDRDFLQLISEKIMFYDDRAKQFLDFSYIKERYNIDPNMFLKYKCLIGDVSDKIPSVRGFGPKKAAVACQTQDFTKNPEVRCIFTDNEQARTFARNEYLIKLPRSCKELVVDPNIKRQIFINMLKTFNRFRFGESGILDLVGAQDLLNKYEIKTFKLEQFLQFPENQR